MREPNEIKKALECHMLGECNESCPYFMVKGGCSPHYILDALSYIEKLEVDLQLEKDMHQHTYECAEEFREELIRHGFLTASSEDGGKV